MRCTSPLSRPSRDHLWVTVACGQCLPCRIRSKSSWCLRCQLESQHALTSSFWTLTYDDTADPKNYRDHMRTFWNTLRAKERRSGNMKPIRYFGCLDFGGKYGRPHFHFLLWNVVATYHEPTKYHDGLPRPRIYMPTWPHGHVDVAEFNPATVNYVCGYIADFDKERLRGCKTIRPATGYSGLKQLAETVAKSPFPITGPPVAIELGGRTWPLDRWSRKTFMDEFRLAGGQRVHTGYSHIQQWKIKQEVATLVEEALPRHVLLNEETKLERWIRGAKEKKKRKEYRERVASGIYFAREAQRFEISHDREAG